MKIQLEDEESLDNYIICHKCHTLHNKVPIADGAKALCTQCGSILYSRDNRLVDRGLALSIAGLIFLVLANVFPLVKIEMIGTRQFISIASMIASLAESGYYLVALFLSYLIFIFPIMIFVIYLLLFSLMKAQKGERLTKHLLVLLSTILPWHMSDIFLISILVALVKLLGMAEIYMGTSFWALLAFVLLDIYITRTIHIGELWRKREQLYADNQRYHAHAVCQ